MATWSQVTIDPDEAAVQALREHWRWQLGDMGTPLVFSALGDVFFEVAAGMGWWLSTATGSLEQVADSREHFTQLLRSDRTDEWFLPGLIDALRSPGKVLGPNQCYTYAVLPVFADGSFSAENMQVAAASEHFALSGQVHERIRKLPDGAQLHQAIGDGAHSGGSTDSLSFAPGPRLPRD